MFADRGECQDANLEDAKVALESRIPATDLDSRGERGRE